MKQFLILGTIASSILFSGCCGIICKPKTIYETKYIERDVPSIPDEPEFIPYKMEKMEFNNKQYYIMDPVNAALLGSNWIQSRTYSKDLRIILKNLDNNSSTK